MKKTASEVVTEQKKTAAYQELNISDSKITVVDKLHQRFDKIQKLDLSNNLLTTFGSISNTFNELKTLNVDSNSIQSLEEIYHLKKMPSLVNLCILNNPVGDYTNFRKIVLTLLPNLRSLNGMPITPVEQTQAADYCRRSFLLLPYL